MELLLAKHTVEIPKLTSQDLISEFTSNLDRFTFKELFSVLEQEISPLNRVIVRAAIIAKDREGAFKLTLEKAIRRVAQTESTRRKNFIRRTYKKWGLFAIYEINKLYPDYTSDMLPADLYVKSKPKYKKAKLRNDFRGCQLAKYEVAYQTTNKETKEYNRICERIASLTYADLKRLPIYLTVTLNGEKYQYSFNWNVNETDIKAFHVMANKKGMTHEELHIFRKASFNSLTKF